MTAAVTVIVGTGRVGLSLARALMHSGHQVRLLSRRARTLPDALPEAESDWGNALASATLLVLAVPDDVLAEVAQRVATMDHLPAGAIVLHASGLHDHTVLDALRAGGAITGSWHPLQSFTQSGFTALSGIPAILEGDARAVAAARAMSVRLGMTPVLELPAAGKARYHAAAVFAANYLVVLAGMAERMAREAGAGDSSAGLFTPIMRQVVENLADTTPAGALTGPVRRGDVGTVAAHLAVLEGDDREAYLVLAREALRLAESAGLAPDASSALQQVIGA